MPAEDPPFEPTGFVSYVLPPNFFRQGLDFKLMDKHKVCVLYIIFVFFSNSGGHIFSRVSYMILVPCFCLFSDSVLPYDFPD